VQLTTWIDIVDDAVKIGLGAAISGLFAWVVARRYTRAEVDKVVLERRAQILAEVSDRYETVFQAYLKYSNLLLGIAGASNDPPEDHDQAAIHRALLAGQGTTATDLRVALHDKMQEAFGAQSRLMLLGESACRKKAEQFHMAVLEADSSFKFDGQGFDLSKYVSMTKAVRDAREEFYSEMSKAFEHTREA
jgi:hypothetical protein